MKTKVCFSLVFAATYVAFAAPAKAQMLPRHDAKPEKVLVAAGAEPRQWARETKVTLSPDEAKSFRVALGRLSQQGQVCILTEGTPLHPTLEPKEVPDLSSPMPLTLAIEKLAMAYDYEILWDKRVTPTDGGGKEILHRRQKDVYVLQKRYSEPDDLPPVTFEECRDVLQKIEQMAESLKVTETANLRPTSTVIAIYRSLTPEQIALMQQHKLAVSALSPVQKNTVRAMAAHIYCTWISDTYSSLNLMHLVEQKGAEQGVFLEKEGYERGVQRKENYGIVFGIEITDALKRRQFMEMYPYMSGPGTGVPMRQKDDLFKISPASPLPVPSFPGEAQTTTLGALTEKVETEASHQSRPITELVHYRVEETLRGKPLVVAGEAFAPFTQRAEACADGFGLRWRTGDTDKERLLAAERAPRIADLKDFPDAIRRVVPNSVLRAIHDTEYADLCHEANRMAQRLNGYKDDNSIVAKLGQNELTEQFAKASTKRSRWEDVPWLMRDAALHQMEQSAENIFRSQSKENQTKLLRLPFADLDEKGKACFGIYSLAGITKQLLGPLSRDLPPYMAQFNQNYLGGSVEEKNGKKIVGMIFETHDEAAHTINQSSGIIGIRLPEP